MSFSNGSDTLFEATSSILHNYSESEIVVADDFNWLRHSVHTSPEEGNAAIVAFENCLTKHMNESLYVPSVNGFQHNALDLFLNLRPHTTRRFLHLSVTRIPAPFLHLFRTLIFAMFRENKLLGVSIGSYAS